MTYRITTYPIQHVLEFGPDAARVIVESRLDFSIGCHLVTLKDLGNNRVQVSCQEYSSAVFVIQDEALCDLLKDGGPDAFLEEIED